MADSWSQMPATLVVIAREDAVEQIVASAGFAVKQEEMAASVKQSGAMMILHQNKLKVKATERLVVMR